MENIKIQKFKNPFRFLFAALLVGSFLFIVSCSKENQIADVQQEELTGEDVFKSVFFADGAFAGKIESYAPNVEVMSNMTAEQKAKFDNDTRRIIASINEASPAFLENFKKDILSGDHQKVETAIIDGGAVLYEHLIKVYPNVDKLYDRLEEDINSGEVLTDGEFDQEKLERNMEEYQDLLSQNIITSEDDVAASPCSWAVACVFYAAIAIHNTIAVTTLVTAVAAGAIAVAAAVTVRVKVLHDDPNGKAGGTNENLAFEMLVHEIATIK